MHSLAVAVKGEACGALYKARSTLNVWSTTARRTVPNRATGSASGMHAYTSCIMIVMMNAGIHRIWHMHMCGGRLAGGQVHAGQGGWRLFACVLSWMPFYMQGPLPVHQLAHQRATSDLGIRALAASGRQAAGRCF